MHKTPSKAAPSGFIISFFEQSFNLSCLAQVFALLNSFNFLIVKDDLFICCNICHVFCFLNLFLCILNPCFLLSLLNISIINRIKISFNSLIFLNSFCWTYYANGTTVSSNDVYFTSIISDSSSPPKGSVKSRFVINKTGICFI